MKIVELKESQKDIDLLQLMVDVTEQKILPASEKLLAQAKEFGRRGEKYAAQQWARLQHFLRTDATCQKLKATAQQRLGQQHQRHGSQNGHLIGAELCAHRQAVAVHQAGNRQRQR